jgi:hypothetical protein
MKPNYSRFRGRLPPRRLYARFYGRCELLSGQIAGFEFQVAVSPRLQLNHKGLHNKIAHTFAKMKYQKILPIHTKGQTYESFQALHSSTWFRIKRILDYDVTVPT